MSMICDDHKKCPNKAEGKSSDIEYDCKDIDIEHHSDMTSDKVIENTDSNQFKTHSYSKSEHNQMQCNVFLPDNSEYKCELNNTSTINDLLNKVKVDCGYSKIDKFDVFYIIHDTHKIWLNNNERIEKQIGSDQWNFKLTLVAAIYLWKPNILLKRIGHLSLKLYDNTYISHWPQELRIKWNKHSEQHITLEDDIKAEKGEPNEVLYLERINFIVSRQDMIINWWNKHKSNWNLLNNNCAQKVHNALMICSFFTNKKLIRPTAVFAYVKRSVKQCHKFRDKYSKEYNDINHLLMNQIEEYKMLSEMEETGQSVESIVIIRQLKISYEVIKQQQEILKRYRDYDEYELLKMVNEKIEKINHINKERNAQKMQSKESALSCDWYELTDINRLTQELEDHELIELIKTLDTYTYYLCDRNLLVRLTVFDLNEINIKRLKFKNKLTKQIKKENQINLNLIRMNKIMLTNGEENEEIREKCSKYMGKYDKNLKAINKKIEKNKNKMMEIKVKIEEIIMQMEMNDQKLSINDNDTKEFYKKIEDENTMIFRI